VVRLKLCAASSMVFVVKAPVPLHQLVGARLRQLREAAGLRQEDVAARAREGGLIEWARGTVAMIELGRRRVTLEEFLVLPSILARAGVGDVRLADLVGEGVALLNPAMSFDAQVVRGFLSGEKSQGWRRVTAKPARSALADSPEAAEAQALWRRWRPSAGPLNDEELQGLILAARGDAEVAAARQLHTSPLAVAMAARAVWQGHSLTEARERLIAMRTDPMLKFDPAEARSATWPRRLQAIRGHATRELIGALKPHLAVFTKKKTKRERS
jgi:transcriptional regulator with XRE-family HTH domain